MYVTCLSRTLLELTIERAVPGMPSIKRIAGLSALLLASVGASYFYAVLVGNTPEHLAQLEPIEPIEQIESAEPIRFSGSQNLLEPINLPEIETPSEPVREESKPPGEQTEQKHSLPPRLLQPANITLEDVEAEFDYLERDRLLDGREFVQFDSRPLRSFKPGQSFTVLLPFEERALTGAVGDIAKFAEVNRLTGKFLDLGDDQINHFSMTVSGDGRYVAGAFSIGDETYTLEAKNGVGWVNKSSIEYEYLIQSEQEQTINFAPHLMSR